MPTTCSRQGDPRGELITLDLQLAIDPQAHLARHRDELLARLLGGAHDLHPTWFQFGFAHPRLTSAHEGSRLESLAEMPFAAFQIFPSVDHPRARLVHSKP